MVVASSITGLARRARRRLIPCGHGERLRGGIGTIWTLPLGPAPVLVDIGTGWCLSELHGGGGNPNVSDPPDTSERALDKTTTEHAQVHALQDTYAERPQQTEGQNLALPEHLGDRFLQKKCAACVPCDSGSEGRCSGSSYPSGGVAGKVSLSCRCKSGLGNCRCTPVATGAGGPGNGTLEASRKGAR